MDTSWQKDDRNRWRKWQLLIREDSYRISSLHRQDHSDARAPRLGPHQTGYKLHSLPTIPIDTWVPYSGAKRKMHGIRNPLQWFGHLRYQQSKPCHLMIHLNLQIMA